MYTTETKKWVMYMANYWSKEESVKIYGEVMGLHFWNKWIGVNESSGYPDRSSMCLAYEMSEHNFEKLVKRAEFVCDYHYSWRIEILRDLIIGRISDIVKEFGELVLRNEDSVEITFCSPENGPYVMALNVLRDGEFLCSDEGCFCYEEYEGPGSFPEECSAGDLSELQLSSLAEVADIVCGKHGVKTDFLSEVMSLYGKIRNVISSIHDHMFILDGDKTVKVLDDDLFYEFVNCRYIMKDGIIDEIGDEYKFDTSFVEDDLAKVADLVELNRCRNEK